MNIPYFTFIIYLRITFENGEKMYFDVHIEVSDRNAYKNPRNFEDNILGCVQNVIYQVTQNTKSRFTTEFIDKKEFDKAKKLEKVKLI